MGSEITGILNKYGAQITANLKADIKGKSLTPHGVLNASGKLADSIRYEADNNGLKVFALDYFYYVEKGRKGGKRPPMKVIEQWITDKGILIEEKKKKSLAFLIARKIGQEGTSIYQQGGTQLLENIVTDELKGQIQSELILTFKEKIMAQMKSLGK